MTTMAWDGTHLAADRQLSTGGSFPCIRGYRAKLEIIAGLCVGSLGRSLDGFKFDNWVRNGSERFAYPEGLEDNFIGLILNAKGQLHKYHNDSEGIGDLVVTKEGYGNAGADFVAGAMHGGKTAMHAVQLAHEYCVFTGGGVDYAYAGSAVLSYSRPSINWRYVTIDVD